MLEVEIDQHFPRWRNDVPPVRLHYFDRTCGETEENYFVVADRGQFASVFEFAAAALMAMAHRIGLSVEDFCELEVHSCRPDSWMHHYDATVRPGSMLCFPPIDVLGFEPPPQLQRKLYLVPHLSGTEESLVNRPGFRGGRLA